MGMKVILSCLFFITWLIQIIWGWFDPMWKRQWTTWENAMGQLCF